jgi:L-alanine-DL-glutamate epimerase-like enolase superfamily enzyme
MAQEQTKVLDAVEKSGRRVLNVFVSKPGRTALTLLSQPEDHLSRIIRVEVGRFDYDFVGEFKFFKPGPDSKIRRPSVLVRLTAEDGIEGWGQAVPVPSWTYETVETVESTLTHYLAGAILGADPADMTDIHRRMNDEIKPAFSVGQPLCKAAVDLACYDLVGKRMGQPVSEMLGGTQKNSLQLSWTVASPNMATVEQQLAAGKARGYDSFNLKVGPPQTPEYDLELVRKARAASPDGFLWADANTGYSLEAALEMAPKLAEAGVEALESPLPPTQFRGYQALKRQGAVPIFMDEGIVSPAEVAEFIALDMVDGITMKLARCAGLWPASQIVTLVKEHRLKLLGSGLSDPDLSLAGTVHLFAWAGIDRPAALNGPQYLADTLAVNDFIPETDVIDVPTGPGLGLTLDRRAEAALSIVAEI